MESETGGILTPGGLIERCLRFELEFQSAITDNMERLIRMSVSAKVPLRIDPGLSSRDAS